MDLIPNRKKSTFLRVIQKHIHPGSLVWTNSHSSYKFLGKYGSGFHWESVNHARRVFSREEDGVVVLTNAVEGLFGWLNRTQGASQTCLALCSGGSRPGTWRQVDILARRGDRLTCRCDGARTYLADRIAAARPLQSSTGVAAAHHAH